MQVTDAQMHEEPAAQPPPPVPRTRPRLAGLTEKVDGPARDRKRPAKSMFGLALGTLKKAKVEDKERNASEAVCQTQRLRCIIFIC